MMPPKTDRTKLLDEIFARRRQFLDAVERFGPHHRVGRPISIESLIVSRGQLRGLLVKGS
jgi:hypothetical protein